MKDASMIVLCVLGLFLGVALPDTGCVECPEYAPEGTWGFRAYEFGRLSGWMPGSGRMEVSETTIVISYTTPDDSRWEVEYERTETYGP